MLKGRYELLKGYENNHVTIGFGSYGQVKLARNLDSKQIVAVKIINKIAKNQILFHNQLSHPKIIRLLNHQIDKDKQITYMVLEYADDGTLFEKIKTSHLSKLEIKRYFRDVCQAISYLHSKQIMHRDIKPQNILLTKKGQAKLCDFGFAAILGQRKTLCGTYQYMSPQMIQNYPYDSKIDIWALGILLFEMISGQAPFKGQSPDQVLNQMKTKIYFCERFQKQEIDLIKMILRVTPHKRPTIQWILDNPFFNEEIKSRKTSETEVSQMKNLNSISSNSNLNSQKSQNKTQNPLFYKRHQKSQNSKQPQNSFPFYVPKSKYNTGSSTGSTGNSGSETSANIIMTQHLSVKKDNFVKNDTVSPRKRDLKDFHLTQSAASKVLKNMRKNNQQLYSGLEPTNQMTTKPSKLLTQPIGNGYNEKFKSTREEQIGIIDSKGSDCQIKGIMTFQNRNGMKTLFHQASKIGSNRFS